MTEPVAAPPAPPPKTSGLAIAAFVLSLIVCFPPLSLLGAVLGIVALVRMSGRTDVGGRTLAIVSIPLGVISVFVTGILAAIAIPSFITYQARAKAMEARSNLMALYTAERAYGAEHGAFTSDMTAIGFSPEHGNRYAYFLADSGPTEARDGSQTAPPPAPVIIGVDRVRYPSAPRLARLADTHCPVTLGRAHGGPALRVGVTAASGPSDPASIVAGKGQPPTFVAVAAGNLDRDPTLDCWSIASVDRRTAGGVVIPAGKPWHEQDDVRR